MVTDVCSTVDFKASSLYIASPNFPDNYPPNMDCRCVISSPNENAKVQMEIVYLAVKVSDYAITSIVVIKLYTSSDK